MKLQTTNEEAVALGFTHEGSYWGLPVYIGDLEFRGVASVQVIVKYSFTDWLFTLISVVEWVLTPPNAGHMFAIGREL